MRDAARVRVGPMKACSNEGELATCGGALTCEEHGGPADLRQRTGVRQLSGGRAAYA